MSATLVAATGDLASADGWSQVLGALSFPILERIPIVGDVALSPHGIGIAAGFLVGALVMMRRAEQRGLGHLYVPDIRVTVQDLLVRGAIGAIIGARLFFVLTHLDLYADDPLAALRIWEGGLTLLGGVAGGVLLALPMVVRRGLRARQLMDSAVPGLAVGIVVGRLGDLVIGDHIGPPTDFVLGWRCTGNYWERATNSFGYVPPHPYPEGAAQLPTAGCFDTVVHQTALYDFASAGVVLLLLLVLERRPRWDGFFLAAFVYGYGALRFVSDFAREDRQLLGLTGSQYTVLAAMVALSLYLWWRKPWCEASWAWDLEFDHPWLQPPEGEGAATPPAGDGDRATDVGPGG